MQKIWMHVNEGGHTLFVKINGGILCDLCATCVCQTAHNFSIHAKLITCTRINYVRKHGFQLFSYLEILLLASLYPCVYA